MGAARTAAAEEPTECAMPLDVGREAADRGRELRWVAASVGDGASLGNSRHTLVACSKRCESQ